MRNARPDSSVSKAYDIRGVFPNQVNENMVWRVGYSFCQCLLIDGCSSPTIVVGRDARESSNILLDAFSSGVAASGAEIIDIGLCTTPMLYFAVNVLGSAGGTMITAFHNPAKYNGFKLVRENAIPIASGSGLEEVRNIAMDVRVPEYKSYSATSLHDEILERYSSFFTERFTINSEVATPHLADLVRIKDRYGRVRVKDNERISERGRKT